MLARDPKQRLLTDAFNSARWLKGEMSRRGMVGVSMDNQQLLCNFNLIKRCVAHGVGAVFIAGDKFHNGILNRLLKYAKVQGCVMDVLAVWPIKDLCPIFVA